MNSHNSTKIVQKCNIEKIFVGNYSYGDLRVYNRGTDYRLNIGHFCSVGEDVQFLLSMDHELKTISTFPFKRQILHDGIWEGKTKGDINIGDDVWIGNGARIMSGVTIGQGAVVAAGAVVTKNVPPYTIIGGVPAKVLKYRFDDDTIADLIGIDYSKWDESFIRNHLEALYDIDIKKALEGLEAK